MLLKHFLQDFYSEGTQMYSSRIGEDSVELIAPGHKKEDFSIELTDGILSVKIKEVGISRYYRLKHAFDEDNIKAEYDAGILKIHLVKTKPKKPKLISID